MRPGTQNRWPIVLLAVYWIVLLTVTHWPHLQGPDIPGKDKTAHFLAYGLLTILVINAAVRRFASHRHLPIALGTIAMVAAAGALDEWTQPYFGRCGEFADWVADSGSAIGVSVIYLAIVWLRPAEAGVAGPVPTTEGRESRS